MADTRTYTDVQLANAIASSTSWRGTLRTLGLVATSAGAIRSIQRHADRLGANYEHLRGQRRWTEADLRDAVAKSQSWSGVARNLGLGSGLATAPLKGHAVRLGIDCSHFVVSKVVPAPGLPQPSLMYLSRAGSALAAAWFGLCGYTVSWPLEPCRFDLIASDGEVIRRVQVKTTTRKEGKSWTVNLTTSGRIKAPYDPDDIDEFFVVDGDMNCYLIPVAVVGGLSAIYLSAYESYRVQQLEPASIEESG